MYLIADNLSINQLMVAVLVQPGDLVTVIRRIYLPVRNNEMFSDRTVDGAIKPNLTKLHLIRIHSES